MKRTSFEINDELRKREDAILNENQTGYPHMDKRFLKYYSMDDIAFYKLPNISMYGMLLNTAIVNYDNTAISYCGRKINYLDLINNIDKYAYAFEKMGIEKGEIIPIISYSSPEVIYSIYALNKIGAIAYLINPNNLDKIDDCLLDSIVIMMDTLYPKLKDLFKEKRVNKVYTIKEFEPLQLNGLQKLFINNEDSKNNICPENDTYKSLEKFVVDSTLTYSKKDYDIYDELKSHYGRGEEVAIIVNTAGTIDDPKGVMLTNTNLNSLATKTSRNEYNRFDSFLSNIPIYNATGIGMCTHLPLVMGLSSIIIPDIDSKKIDELIIKNKPNHLVLTPNGFQNILDSKAMKIRKLSYLRSATCVGEGLTLKQRNSIKEFLDKHSSITTLNVSYSLTENTGFVTSEQRVVDFNQNSVGIPNIHTNIIIEDFETKKILGYNHVGEIVLNGESIMSGYFNNPELTKEVIEEKEKERFLHTGDLGYIDEDGCLYIVGRKDRLIKTSDGYIIAPSLIEGIALRHDFVDECACMSNNVTKNPIVFLKIKKGYEDRIEQIIEELKLIAMDVSISFIELDYVIVDEIPKTQDGKVDYNNLENNYVNNNVTRTRRR